MRTALLRRELPPVVFDASDVGDEFAIAPADLQVQFLLAWAATAHKFSWPMQCRHIVDSMSDAERAIVTGVLDTLLEHLREPRIQTAVTEVTAVGE